MLSGIALIAGLFIYCLRTMCANSGTENIFLYLYVIPAIFVGFFHGITMLSNSFIIEVITQCMNIRYICTNLSICKLLGTLGIALLHTIPFCVPCALSVCYVQKR